ncbi:MAG: glycosyltransferase, partial [Chloroflexi bacterium]|nr:glycosyltransferase [Chloroflexota bacterium]
MHARSATPLRCIVVIPTFNEAENLRKLVPCLFELNIEGVEVLVVDDNSPDG